MTTVGIKAIKGRLIAPAAVQAGRAYRSSQGVSLSEKYSILRAG